MRNLVNLYYRIGFKRSDLACIIQKCATYAYTIKKMFVSRNNVAALLLKLYNFKLL